MISHKHQRGAWSSGKTLKNYYRWLVNMVVPLGGEGGGGGGYINPPNPNTPTKSPQQELCSNHSGLISLWFTSLGVFLVLSLFAVSLSVC